MDTMIETVSKVLPPFCVGEGGVGEGGIGGLVHFLSIQEVQ